MMKKTMKFLSIMLIVLTLVPQSFAANDSTNTQVGGYLENLSFTPAQKEKNLTIQGLFILYFNAIGEGIPDSYKDIQLKFRGIKEGSLIYDALQKGVYLDLIKNRSVDLQLDRTATQAFFSKLVQMNFDVEVVNHPNTPLKLNYFLDVMKELKVLSTNNSGDQVSSGYDIENVSNFPILNDVFSKLKTLHYDSGKFKDEDLIQGAIKGMTDATGDKYTTYFPPVEAKNFSDELSGEFEGIGASVDMSKPGIFTIVAPMKGSPAEKAGLKPGDQVIKIDDFVITEKISLQDAVNKVKGKAGTKVKLTILRAGQQMEITVTRAKVTIPYVEYKKLQNGDNYISISTFGAGSAKAFSGAVAEAMKNQTGKLILDLRNNPGGSLEEVSDMLEFFVPKGDPVVNIKYKNYSSDISSTGTKGYSFLGKHVVVLINKGSASASEIMAGTIRDYLGIDVKIIGEQSFGKGSVQALDDYADGSSFKYTVAKWFTGKTKTGIDGVGIKPDISLPLDEAQYKNGIDNQLDTAKAYSF